MPLDLEFDVGQLRCLIGEHRLVCTTQRLAIGRLRLPFVQILDLRVSRHLFFVEVATRTGTHRFYASPRPWEHRDWERLSDHLLHWHQRAHQQGDRADVPSELLRLRKRPLLVG
ncbi:MAG: hypothetical protein AAGA48_05015 [Myxococcota bacterium]